MGLAADHGQAAARFQGIGAAILAAVGAVEGPGFPRTHLPEGGAELFPGNVQFHVPHVHSQQLFPAVAQVQAGLLVHVEKAPVQVHHVDAVGSLVDELAEAGLAFPQGFLRLFAHGDVVEDGHVVGGVLVLVANQAHQQVGREGFPVLAAAVDFPLPLAMLRQFVGNPLPEGVVGMILLQLGEKQFLFLVQQFRLGETGEIEEGGVEGQHPALGVGNENGRGAGIHHLGGKAGGFVHQLLAGFRLGAVPQGHAEEADEQGVERAVGGGAGFPGGEGGIVQKGNDFPADFLPSSGRVVLVWALPGEGMKRGKEVDAVVGPDAAGGGALHRLPHVGVAGGKTVSLLEHVSPLAAELGLVIEPLAAVVEYRYVAQGTGEQAVQLHGEGGDGVADQQGAAAASRRAVNRRAEQQGRPGTEFGAAPFDKRGGDMERILGGGQGLAEKSLFVGGKPAVGKACHGDAGGSPDSYQVPPFLVEQGNVVVVADFFDVVGKVLDQGTEGVAIGIVHHALHVLAPGQDA